MQDELYDNARWLVGAIARGLHRRDSDAADVVLERLSEQAIGRDRLQIPHPTRLPMLRHLPQCLGEAMMLDSDLAAAIAANEDNFEWRQTAHYSDAIMGDGFMANYGWAEIIGPHGFFPGEDFLLGLLMLGPHRYYRERIHVAPELYWPLTSSSQWSKSGGGFKTRDQGALIWHPPMTMHATKTGDVPLLAVWCWLRDTSLPAKLVES
jgi:hypothetical protein